VQNIIVPEGGKPKDTFQKLVMEAAGIKVMAPPSVKKPRP